MLRQLQSSDRLLIALLAFAFALRCAAVVIRWDNLSIDRDAYLAIAENVQAGHGFCSVPGRPTAFRPPLYPLLLAVCLTLGGAVVIAAVQITLGTATVGLTWKLTRNAGFSRPIALLAGLLTAVDPLLLELTSQPMTETLFTFLTTALMSTLTRPDGVSVRHPVQTGLLVGLAALCRPSIWAFILLWAGLTVVRQGLQAIRRRFIRPHASPREQAETGRITAANAHVSRQNADTRNTGKRLATAALVAGLTVSPWMLRNWHVFGRPILMTTHGGYTLALGNNRFFYQDVVAGPESVWSDAGLRHWQHDSERRIARAGIDRTDELARDAALSRQAFEWIVEHPSHFAEACLLRLKRFWAVRPQRFEAGSGLLAATIGVWYSAVLALALAGLFRHRHCLQPCHAVLGFALSLTLLHAVYWANMRMRAPLVPIVSLLAASVAAEGRSRQSDF